MARARGRASSGSSERGGREAKPLADYPERLGRYPAAVALFAFVALELAYADPSSPRALAFAIALYTYVALFGMAAFGRETWERHGEGFAVLFGFFARIGPLFARDGRIRVRWPLTGLAGADRIPGTLAFVAVMLGSVLFDGYSRTTTWQDLAARVEGPFIVDRPLVGELLVTLVEPRRAARRACCSWPRRTRRRARRRGGPSTRRAACSATSSSRSCRSRSSTSSRTTSRPSCIQGQFAVPLLSDPLGRGWNLFGTADVVPNLAAVTPTTTWYVQVGALVAGHVAGLAIAHDRAVTIFPDRRTALRSQLPLLALMVLYTVGGLWVLSRGSDRPPPEWARARDRARRARRARRRVRRALAARAAPPPRPDAPRARDARVGSGAEDASRSRRLTKPA